MSEMKQANDSRHQPENNRVVLLDILRGFALIGILLPNIYAIASIPRYTNESDRWIWGCEELLFKGRLFPIFSMLFGIGFSIFVQNCERASVSASQLWGRRLGYLFLLGVPHQFFHPGEFLLPYSIFGWILLPFHKLQNRLALAVSLLLILGGVFTTAMFMIPGLFLLGAVLGRIGYVRAVHDFWNWTLSAWIISLILIPLLCYWQLDVVDFGYRYPRARATTGLVMAVFWATSIILLPKSEQILKPLAAFGRMALTNYVMQTLIVYLVDRVYPLTPTDVPIVWIAIWPLQIVASNLWLQRCEFGPLEWLWRWGTYRKRPNWKLNPQRA